MTSILRRYILGEEKIDSILRINLILNIRILKILFMKHSNLIIIGQLMHYVNTLTLKGKVKTLITE